MSFMIPIGQMNIMMQLGSFQFSIMTAVYQELTRKNEYKWPSQHRFGRRPSRQFVGVGDETMQLPGIIYPEYRGGFQQVEAMRNMAARGQPLLLVDGLGKLWGRWVIESIDEKQSLFAAFGAPRKQEFTLSLARFD